MRNLKDYNNRKEELEEYITNYEEWRKNFYELKFRNPSKYKDYITQHVGDKSVREWIKQREIKINDFKEELENIKEEIKRFDYVQPLIIIAIIVAVVILIGTIAITTPTGFAVSTRSVADEVFINVPADEEIIVEHLVFNSGLKSCSNLDVSVDGRQVDYSVVHANYDDDGCKEAYLVFNNVNYNIKNSRYRVSSYEV
ncbi:MAG: hypothetical protein J4445_01245 [DPANN group archaeon]|nr:hypothetical protein [DPANN group archaeon]